uniref:Lipopolysaccharide transport system ATP-binding protein n=1 Tax=Candidatus Kentrum sp. LPFa TaxID=2126335 RepID=A0A450W419_9GAMM|nr:MAG: lipopolysaccharide transport system ATP-binding protein [Candidatus Kentron sp. LPFa]
MLSKRNHPQGLPSDVSIRADNICKRYALYDRPVDRLREALWRGKRGFSKEISVLEEISFEIERGETVGIIGRNGAGKSTLLQIIAGILQPSAGKVQVAGRIAPLIELGTGFNPEFTGRDNVFAYSSLLGMNQQEIEGKFDDIAKFADIGEYIERPVKTYSSGMHARLAFAVAIHVDPEILIVDEILSVGDAPFQRKCLNRFYEIKESGCTILIVAHDQYLIRSLCAKALYLKGGRQAGFGSASEITALYLEDISPKASPDDRVTSQTPTLVEADNGTSPENGEPSTSTHEGDRPTALEEGEQSPTPSSAASSFGQLFTITGVYLWRGEERVEQVRTGDTLRLTMRFAALSDELPEAISFVFNLYTHDGFYVCGSTTLMEGHAPYKAGREGQVSITFPNIALLAGKYIWRVAINDHGGILVHTDAKGVCPFKVVDDFHSVGLYDMQRRWEILIDGQYIQRSIPNHAQH